jgi:hypothetical protein
VFDSLGFLLHRTDKPVTKERVENSLKFIRNSISKRLAVPMGVSQEDEIREHRLGLPWKLNMTSDRVVLQSNPAARCYSAETK